MDTVVFHLLVETLRLALYLSIPVLGAALLSGACSGVVQATTTVQDSSLSTVPRLALGAIALITAGPWLMSKLIQFTMALFSDLNRFAS